MKIKALITLILISTFLSLTASAHTFSIKDGVPSDWIVYETEAKTEKSTMDGEDGILVNVETDGGVSMVALTTGKVDLSGDMTLSLRMSIADDGGAGERYLYLNDAVPVITITGTDVTIFDLPAFEVEADKLLDLDISYKESTGAVKVWLDGALVCEGETTSVGDYNKDSSTLTISSYIMGATGNADWFFSKICATNKNSPALTVYPKEKEAVVAEELTSISAEFGVLTSYSTKNGGEVKLYKNDVEEAVTVKRDETQIQITPESGFVEGSTYRVVLKGGYDVFGNALEDIDYKFTTVRSGYVAPSVRITAPESGKKLLSGETVTIELDVTKGSEEIVKAELYENGTLVATDNDAPYSFSYSSDAGVKEIVAVVTDAAGAEAESEAITLNVSENAPPVVKLIGVKQGGEVLMNKSLEISVSDENENFSYAEAYLDGEKLEKLTDTSFKYPDNTFFGRRTLTVYAYDTAGAEGKAAVTAYFTKAEVENEINQDMSSYTATKSEGKYPAGINSHSITSGFVCSEEIEGRNSMALGVNADMNGKTSYAGISWQGGTDMPKEQLVCEMDILFGNIKSQFMNTIRSNEDTVRFSEGDFIFREGTLTINNGGSASKTLSYEANRWYNIRMEISLANGIYSLWLDGELLADNYALKVPVPNISQLRFPYTARTDEESAIYISKFYVDDVIPYPYLKTSDIEESGMSLSEKSINAFFSKETGENFVLTDAEFILGKANEAAEAAVYDKEASSVYAVMKSSPSQSGEYQLLVSGKYMGFPMKTILDFNAAAGSFDAVNTGFIKTADGVCFKADMQNDTGKDQNALAVIIKYESGIMTEIESFSEKVTADGATLTTPAVSTEGVDVSIIGVLWNDWANRVPLNNNIYTYEN